ATATVEVPFPALPPGCRSLASPQPREALTALVEHVLTERSVGVLLARLGGHAAGVFVGPRVVAAEVGSRHVPGRAAARRRAAQRGGGGRVAAAVRPPTGRSGRGRARRGRGRRRGGSPRTGARRPRARWRPERRRRGALRPSPRPPHGARLRPAAHRT